MSMIHVKGSLILIEINKTLENGDLLRFSDVDENTGKRSNIIYKIYNGDKDDLNQPFDIMQRVIVCDDEIKVGDKCLFYDAISDVLEIINSDKPYSKRFGKIRSLCNISDHDRKILKTDALQSYMTHGFGLSQMKKILVLPEQFSDLFAFCSKDNIVSGIAKHGSKVIVRCYHSHIQGDGTPTSISHVILMTTGDGYAIIDEEKENIYLESKVVELCRILWDWDQEHRNKKYNSFDEWFNEVK